MTPRQQLLQLVKQGDIPALKTFLSAHSNLLREEKGFAVTSRDYNSQMQEIIKNLNTNIVYLVSKQPNNQKVDEIIDCLVDHGLDIPNMLFKGIYRADVSLLGVMMTFVNNADSVPNDLLPLFRIALQYNDIYIHDALYDKPLAKRIVDFKRTSSEAAKLLLCEGLIRGHRETIDLLKSRLGDIKLEDIKQQISSRKFSSQLFLNYKNNHLALAKEESPILAPDLSKSILAILEEHLDYSSVLQNYPECMRAYLATEIKQRFSHSSLDELVARLQYARNQIPAPYTLDQLKLDKIANAAHIDFAGRNPELYEVKVLQAFISSSNAMQSLIELTLYKDELVPIICEVALNDHLTEQERGRCVALLSRFENPNELDQAAMVGAQLNFEIGKETEARVTQLENSLLQRDQTIAALQETVKIQQEQINKLFAMVKKQETNTTQEENRVGTKRPFAFI